MKAKFSTEISNQVILRQQLFWQYAVGVPGGKYRNSIKRAGSWQGNIVLLGLFQFFLATRRKKTFGL